VKGALLLPVKGTINARVGTFGLVVAFLSTAAKNFSSEREVKVRRLT
jgi:hypothetical protein